MSPRKERTNDRDRKKESDVGQVMSKDCITMARGVSKNHIREGARGGKQKDKSRKNNWEDKGATGGRQEMG